MVVVLGLPRCGLQRNDDVPELQGFSFPQFGQGAGG